MIKIDSHLHFWKYNLLKHAWITSEMNKLKRDFLPEHIKSEFIEHDIAGCIAVQAEQTKEENFFLAELAAENKMIKGIVGWVDFESDKLPEYLALYSSWPGMVGFRHILQAENQQDFMLRPRFLQGIKQLLNYEFTYDILIAAHQLEYTRQFVKKNPNQKFVIDHIGKPGICKSEITQWKKHIAALAEYENVYCKISGMTTEADWQQWKEEDIIPYIEHVVAIFGTNRIMYGSDWPVCLLAGNYKATYRIVRQYFSSFSQKEQEKFFALNARAFYGLSE